MNLDEKLKLWIKITGVDPLEEKKSWNIPMSGKLSDWDIKKMNDKLMEVVKYDTDEATYTNIFLREYFNEFLKGKSVSFYEYLDKKNQHEVFFLECLRLKDALNEDIESEKSLIEEAQRVIEHYAIKESPINIFDIAYLKISARHNIENLSISQFKKGSSLTKELKYSNNIYMVENIGKLIETVETHATNIISLNYIYDAEEPSSSYFAFLIKNGQNIYILTDKPSYSHPNQKYMKRTPGRNMDERINKAYFPYSLTGLELSKYSVSDQNSDKIKGYGYVNIGTIADMKIDEALWVTNMFVLIQDKFFTNKYECEIAYVGGMIQHSLIEDKNNDLVVYNSYEKLTLPVIEQPDKIELEYEYESVGLFQDDIERFKDKVDIKTINAIGYSDNFIDDKSLLGNSDLMSWNRPKNDLLMLNVNDYGTRDELEYRQKWIARFNFAKQIDKFSKEEYERTNKEISNWYKDKVTKNLDNIMDMVISNKLRGNEIVSPSMYGRTISKSGSIVKKYLIKEYLNDSFGLMEIKQKDSYRSGYDCSFSGNKASIAICIFPNSTNDLIALTGCSEEEIPDVLKKWSPHEKRSSGNMILRNIDPCDWVIKDYWYRFPLQIAIFLSKTEYNNQYKKRGLDPVKFWLENADINK